jgi:hypothetical protein
MQDVNDGQSVFQESPTGLPKMPLSWSAGQGDDLTLTLDDSNFDHNGQKCETASADSSGGSEGALVAVPRSEGALVAVPQQAPADVPALVTAPQQAPAAAPQQDPAAVPQQAPAAVPQQDPAAAPQQAPAAVPQQAPAAAPQQVGGQAHGEAQATQEQSLETINSSPETDLAPGHISAVENFALAKNMPMHEVNLQMVKDSPEGLIKWSVHNVETGSRSNLGQAFYRSQKSHATLTDRTIYKDLDEPLKQLYREHWSIERDWHFTSEKKQSRTHLPRVRLMREHT